MNEIWCNGEWLPADKYPGAAQDRGAFLGLGLFETMGAIEGRVAFVDRHLARIHQSCARLGWSVDLENLRDVASELLVRNSLAAGRARLRLIVTAGSGLHNDLTQSPDHLVWLAAFSAGETPEGVSVCLSPWPRNERSPLAGMKTACYAENLIALDHARRHGFDEAIFLNTAGHLCEAATANLFLVRNGILLTPSLESGCLPGIGREVICEIARSHGIPCEEKVLTPDDLRTADEVFLSSATRGPFAVSRLEDKRLKSRTIVEQLRKHWFEAVRTSV